MSLVNTTSKQTIDYRRKNNRFTEIEDYSNNSTAFSSAILFNPSFQYCKNSAGEKDRYSIIVSVEKNSFHQLAISYFDSTLKRAEQKLESHKLQFQKDSNYDFTEELRELELQLNLLSSYYALMISLTIDKQLLDRYIDFEKELYLFANRANSLKNNLRLAEKHIRDFQFTAAHKILTDLKTKYPNNSDLIKTIDRYNRLVKDFRLNRLNELKKESSSFNHLSFELGFNSTLLNNYKGSGGLDSYNNNKLLDRLYPYIETKFISNDRDHKFSIGGYFRYNFSNALIVLSKREYFFPFSNAYSETGVTSQYFLKNNRSRKSNTAFTLSFGKLLETFKSETGTEINFWNISPGIKTYLTNRTNESFATSLVIRMNLVLGGNQYSYNNFSIGISRDLKTNRRLSEQNKNRIDELYKVID